MSSRAQACLRVAVVLLAAALPAAAAYLEGDDGAGVATERIAPRPPPPPAPRPDPANPVHRLIEAAEIGEPWYYRGLSFYPIRIPRRGESPSLRTLDEALAKEWVTIREKDSAEVSELQVRNDSRHHVFAMTGEVIAGGKQNRLLRDDLLLPPDSGFVRIQVYCGERERWQGPTEIFKGRQVLAHPALRMNAARGAGQDAVWNEIGAASERAGTASPTRDYLAVPEEPQAKAAMAECADGFRRFCPRDAAGLVAARGRRVIGADLFSDPDLFAALQDKLVRSYALDVVRGGEEREKVVPTRGTVRDFLDAALRARYEEVPTPGVGRLLSVRGAADGSALVWTGSAVHVALFGERHDESRPVPLPGPRPWFEQQR